MAGGAGGVGLSVRPLVLGANGGGIVNGLVAARGLDADSRESTNWVRTGAGGARRSIAGGRRKGEGRSGLTARAISGCGASAVRGLEGTLGFAEPEEGRAEGCELASL